MEDNSNRNDIATAFIANRPLFIALGDELRQEILLMLTDGRRRSVAEIALELDVPRPSLSHHIKILRDAELLEEEREGVRRYYRPVFTSHLSRIELLLEELRYIEREIDYGEYA